jgi:copper(I)-binding protein
MGVAPAFMLISNAGNGDDKLKGCSIKEYPFIRERLHDFDKGKITGMREIKVPANKTTDMRKGNNHLIFYGLPEKLSDEVTLILSFRKSGRMEVKAKINKN